MFNKLKLSTKIFVGFFLVILIMVFLGVFSIFNMMQAQDQVEDLTDIQLTQIEYAVGIEKEAAQLMYEMRGYAFREEDSFYNLALEDLRALKQYISGAITFARDNDLREFLDSVRGIETGVIRYEELMDETVQLINDLRQNTETIINAASNYITNSEEYVQAMTDEMIFEIENDYDNERLLDRLNNRITLANNVLDLGNEVDRAFYRSVSENDPSYLQNGLRNFAQAREYVTYLLANTRQDINVQRLTNIRNAINNYEQAVESYLQNRTRLNEVDRLRTQVGTQQVLNPAEEFAYYIVGLAQTEGNDLNNQLTTTILLIIVVLIIAVVIGIVLAIFIGASISKPIRKIVEGLKEGSEQVASASDQLSSSSQELAESSSEQASSIEETSSTLEESSSMIKQNSENSRQAASLSQKAKESSEEGNVQMREMMKSMEQLKESSGEIQRIIKVIDEIAFQTNILALNAAVEAARAGEAGQGFAVVAEEVRNLAGRSAKAAKDTAEIIEKNITLSEQGVVSSTKVGKSLEEITTQATKVNELINEIAAASEEQTQGIEQITKAIRQIEQSTQTVASTSEESASASEELTAQAESVDEFVKDLLKLVEGQKALDTMRDNDRSKKMMKTKKQTYTQKNKYTPQKKQTSNYKPKKTEVVNPEKVIPLEDDMEDF